VDTVIGRFHTPQKNISLGLYLKKYKHHILFIAKFMPTHKLPKLSLTYVCLDVSPAGVVHKPVKKPDNVF